jgi:hypothetical protein
VSKKAVNHCQIGAQIGAWIDAPIGGGTRCAGDEQSLAVGRPAWPGPIAAVAGAMAVGALSLVGAPAQALQTTIPLTASPSVSNQTSRTFSGGLGIQATFSGARSTLGIAKTVDNTANGICLAKSGPALGSCGRPALPPLNQVNGILNQGSINLAFNKALNFKGFRVGLNNMDQFPGTAALNFLRNGVSFASFNYASLPAGGTLYRFPGAVWYTPGDVISIVNTGTSLNPFQATRNFYVNELEVEVTPAPLPVLASGAAFAWSRRLRRRLVRATVG